VLPIIFLWQVGIIAKLFLEPLASYYWGGQLFYPCHAAPSLRDSIQPWMSSTRQAVILLPNLTGAGKRPDLTPAHQVDFPTGIIFRTSGKRINPV
jgi:hypothetical protein